MKFLIVGRTSTGKDTLANILTYKYGWKFVKSMTTRPKRYAEEDTHVFISEEEANKIPQEDRVAHTIINDYQYFATKKQVEECDGYIIDPFGAYVLLDKMPDEEFYIIYIRPYDYQIQREKAISRSDDKEKEIKIFESRYSNECEQFENFEYVLDSYQIYKSYKNVKDAIQYINIYDTDATEYFAHTLNIIKNFY